jgi:hypothetical protein
VTIWWPLWARASVSVSSPASRSPLGRRHYDLRHAAVSLWLNSGCPPPRSPAAPGTASPSCSRSTPHCIDGQATAANQRIAEALGTHDAEQDPGDEDDDDTKQAS